MNANLMNKFTSYDLMNYKPNYQKAYVIAITPRSGSALLCDLLISTGVAGRPMEFFNSNFMNLPKYSDDSTLGKYFSKLVDTTKSKNGVFGIKISYTQASPLIENSLLKQLLPNAKYINLFRRNIVKQAISLHIAAKFKYFHTGDHNEMRDELLNNIDYDADVLFTRVKSIYNEEKGWLNYLDSRAIPCMRLFYEDIIKDIDQSIKCILTYTGLGIDDLKKMTLAESRFKKTSTEVNDELYERFISDEELINRTRALGIQEERWLYG